MHVGHPAVKNKIRTGPLMTGPLHSFHRGELTNKELDMPTSNINTKSHGGKVKDTT